MFTNLATSSPLGFLSQRTFTDVSVTPANTFFRFPQSQAPWVDSNNILNSQVNNQFVWFEDSNNNISIYSGFTGSLELPSITDNDDFSSLLINSTLNPGLLQTGDTISLITDFSSGGGPVGHSWTGTTGNVPTDLLSCVYPYLTTINNLVDSGQQKLKTINGTSNFIIPLNIYFRFNGSGTVLYTVPTTSTTPAKKTRTLKFFLETQTATQPIEFTIVFTLNQFNTTNITGGNVYYNIIQSTSL